MDYSRLKNLSVVFAEDENDTREIMGSALEDFFGSLVVVKNGAEAFEVTKKIKPDVLITDIIMPELNGFELISKLQDENIRPAAVFITSACREPEYFLSSIKLKVDGYLLKPLHIKELFAQIITVLEAKKRNEDIEVSKRLINAISFFVGGKKIEIIKHIVQESDEDGIFLGSYEDVMGAVNASKPTVVSTFKQLYDAGLIERIRNKCYKLKA